MKFSRRLIFAAILFVPIFVMPAMADDHTAWHACQKDDDCVLVPHTYCFSQTAINKAYLDSYNTSIADYERQAAKCDPQPPNDLTAVAKCQSAKCSMVIPAKPPNPTN